MISLRARTIAIIGAGPSEKAFDKIVLFEQRSRSGGIWNYTKDQREEDLFTVPQTDPRGKNQDPAWVPSQKVKDGEKDTGRKEPSFLSPIYDRLETSIPREIYDAVIVANGHFIVPYIPDIPGICAWNAQYPGLISHAEYYRAPEDFTGKKVVVVGNSASGTDISSQIAQYSQRPLLWSSKLPSMFNVSTSPLKHSLPPIAKFLPETRGVVFEDGTVENDIDAVVFATGYFYSLPFRENVRPKLISDGARVQHTYQHLFYTPRPTLSFLALPQRVIPFPIAEAQSAEQDIIEGMGDGRNFHLLPFPKDGNYINELSHWALSAEVKEGLENEGKGKVPPVWGKWEFWCREKFPEIRAAFGALGEKRYGVRTLEEMGFRKRTTGKTHRSSPNTRASPHPEAPFLPRCHPTSQYLDTN
ncbi:FAD/NAD(P)-binding domain-containing protein [Bimuria novae-zelandiae CBS 107.79]|uniref:FAD/NAD(P)-binding domain-containing protein n=1 Tax=Bimuria novae-zelandiae CBS 107.79 TaxID=1447943 RepID=A0A6A5UQP8_9PLEO|nr:FAD/NAD(P)-binding domain-containing protein [Bimuria novae-zelandiae CBS 107.79]